MANGTNDVADRVLEFAGRLLTALAFLTRIPLPSIWMPAAGRAPDLASAIPLFPIAGAVIGAIGAAIVLLLSGWLPPMVVAGIALAALMLATGGLHEDGLTDCADAFGATRDRSKALEILRDSRIGVFGAAALIVSILLRWAALASLSASAAALALIIAHSAGRAAIAIGPGLTTYARTEGTGLLLAGGIDRTKLLLTFAVAAVIAILFGGWAGLMAGIVGVLAAALMLAYAQARIGGYTGDVLGAIEQVCEIAVLCVLAGLWGG